jgi:hypothetical protein
VMSTVAVPRPVNDDQTDSARQGGGVVHDELRGTTG